MSKKPFREHHLLQLLDSYETQHFPLDFCISQYFRANKALGSKDRAEISEIVYGIVRWKDLISHLCKKQDWESLIKYYENFEPVDYINDNTIPLHTRVSFPKDLFDLIEKSHGEKKTVEICLASNQPAPTTVRINPSKTTRDEQLKRWEKEFSVIPCKHSKNGITFLKKINFFSLPEFKEGFFEIQDEGSQLLAELVQASPGEQILDYCSGSGGKTLAFANRLQGSGQIYLHDIRRHILVEARKRLKRAGIQIAQTTASDSPKLKKIKKKMNWVLVDAPCTGTGTLRRNPDMKWKFNKKMVTRLIGQQRMIFEKALSFLHPDGKIVYSTCSILNEENQEQLDHFIKTYDLEIIGEPFQCIPKPGEMDGFFGVTLKRRSLH